MGELTEHFTTAVLMGEYRLRANVAVAEVGPDGNLDKCVKCQLERARGPRFLCVLIVARTQADKNPHRTGEMAVGPNLRQRFIGS